LGTDGRVHRGQKNVSRAKKSKPAIDARGDGIPSGCEEGEKKLKLQGVYSGKRGNWSLPDTREPEIFDGDGGDGGSVTNRILCNLGQPGEGHRKTGESRGGGDSKVMGEMRLWERSSGSKTISSSRGRVGIRGEERWLAKYLRMILESCGYEKRGI